MMGAKESFQHRWNTKRPWLHDLTLTPQIFDSHIQDFQECQCQLRLTDCPYPFVPLAYHHHQSLHKLAWNVPNCFIMPLQEEALTINSPACEHLNNLSWWLKTTQKNSNEQNDQMTHDLTWYMLRHACHCWAWLSAQFSGVTDLQECPEWKKPQSTTRTWHCVHGKWHK